MTLNSRLYRQYAIFIVSFFIISVVFVWLVMEVFETKLFEELEEKIIASDDYEVSYEDVIFYTSQQVYALNYRNKSDLDFEGFVTLIEDEDITLSYDVPDRISPIAISKIHDLDAYTNASSIYLNKERKEIYLQFPTSGIVYVVTVDETLMETLAYFNSVSIIFIMLLFFLLITYTFTQVVNDIIKPTSVISKNLAAIRQFDFEHISQFDTEQDIEELEELIDNSHALASFLQNYVNEKNTLASAITHEIRSPLNTINSLVIGYQAGIEPYSDIDYFIEQLQEKVEELSEISKYILHVYEVTEINKDIVNFNEHLKKALIDKEPSFKVNNLHVDIIENGVFEAICSKQIVDLIMSNILKNITIYAKKDSRVLIRIENDNIIFINKKNNQSGLGTQKGLKLTTQQLKQDGMDLYYNDIADEYIVCINKRSK